MGFIHGGLILTNTGDQGQGFGWQQLRLYQRRVDETQGGWRLGDVTLPQGECLGVGQKPSLHESVSASGAQPAHARRGAG